MKQGIFLLVIISFVLLAFRPGPSAICRRQGIQGHVYRVAGNQMPSPDRPPSAPRGMKTILYIYELTSSSQVIREGAFYKSVSTHLVKKIETDENGHFKVRLKPGFYSLFVKKGELFYSSVFDEKNNIHPVEVKKGEWTEDIFQANYDAVY